MSRHLPFDYLRCQRLRRYYLLRRAWRRDRCHNFRHPDTPTQEAHDEKPTF